MDLAQKNILVVGLGKSGRAVAQFAAQRGAGVTVTDINPASALGDYLTGLAEMGVRLVLGEHPAEIFESAEIIVVSVPMD